MTNHDLLIQIKNDKIKDAFKYIYLQSEKILFDNYIANQIDYNDCKKMFIKYFLINT